MAKKNYKTATAAVPASRKAEMISEVATIQSDPARALTLFMGTMGLQTEDPVLQKEGPTKWKIYDEILQDPRLFAVWSKRIRALQAYDWEVIPASDDAQDTAAADMVREQFQALGIDEATETLMDALWKGFTAPEVIWEYIDGCYCVAALKPICHSRLRYRATEANGWELRLLTQAEPFQGIPVPPRKFLSFSYGSKTGNPYGHGLASRAFWPVFFKKSAIKFWLIFGEKFGSPTAVGQVRKGAPLQERDALLKALSRIAQDAGIVVDEDQAVTLLEAANKSGSCDCYEGLCRYMDEQLAELILGETGSTNQSGGGGSRARDQVGNEVRLEVAQADSDLLCDGPLGTLARWIVEVNLPGARPPKVRRVVEAAKDLKSLAERDKILYELGWERTDDSIREHYGEGFQRRAVLQMAAPEKLQSHTVSGASSSENPSFAETTGAAMPSKSMQALSASLSAAAPAAMQEALAGIEKLMDEATSLEDLQTRLALAYAEIPAARFQRLVESGILAGQLTGRAEVVGGVHA